MIIKCIICDYNDKCYCTAEWTVRDNGKNILESKRNLVDRIKIVGLVYSYN